MKWLAINAWLFAKDPLSVLQITLKSQRIALLIKYIHISVRDILLVLLPLFEAWKESCGGIFSMIADSRDCDKILRLALTLSTAQRNATSCLLSAKSKRPPGKRNKRVTLQYHMCIMAFVKNYSLTLLSLASLSFYLIIPLICSSMQEQHHLSMYYVLHHYTAVRTQKQSKISLFFLSTSLHSAFNAISIYKRNFSFLLCYKLVNLRCEKVKKTF